MNLFGFEIKRAEDKKPELMALDIRRDVADASVVVTHEDPTNKSAEDIISGYLDTAVGSIDCSLDDSQKIERYRELALVSEVDEAINEIRNEVFIFGIPGKKAFDIDFLDNEYAPSKSIQSKIAKEVETLYLLSDFDNRGMEYFSQWYIDSRSYYQKIIDPKKPHLGIRSIRPLDPLNIRKVKIVHKNPDTPGVDLNKMLELYVYSNRWGKDQKYGQTLTYSSADEIYGLKINKNAITEVKSGLIDQRSGKTIGYLDKVIVPYNQLKLMEDALIITRVARAPVRLAFYVEMNNLQKHKSDEVLKQHMARYRTKIAYDPKTGGLTDRANVMSMLDNYWIARRSGSNTTSIETIDGQDMSGQLEQVEYFRDKLWRALGVPRSRFGENANGFVFGKSVEIQRDEYRFKKFLDTLRRHFMVMFEDLLKTQLILKNIIKESEWDDIAKSFFWVFAEDNAFVEYKESEILNNRIQTLQAVEPYIGKFFSVEWCRKKILRLTNDEIRELETGMEKEEKRGEHDGFDKEHVKFDQGVMPDDTDSDSETNNDNDKGGENGTDIERKTTISVKA